MDLTTRTVSVTIAAFLTLTIAFLPANADCSPDPWADLIVQSSPTVGDPMSVLGPPDGILADFEEINGTPGFVTVEFFDDVIVDGPGDDFLIYVVDFAASEWVETFELFVSEDGIQFTSLGVVVPTSPFQNMPESLGFDLSGSGVDAVRQIKVAGQYIDPNLGEGVDIDAFEALHCAGDQDPDLQICLDDLDACTDELGICEGELMDANSGWDACLDDLVQVQTELGECQQAADAAAASLEEARAGLLEILRLTSLPPGHRTSDFSCAGELCPEIQQAIEALTTPQGLNLRREGRHRRR